MSPIKTSRQCLYGDLQNVLEDFEENDNKNENKKISRAPLCPQMIISIFSVPVSSLIDTGSQITAVSEDFYKYITLHGKVTELPVSNLSLFTAIGKNPTTIKKQIMVEIAIGDKKYSTGFLVVSKLSNSIILGNDWFLTNNVIIDYKNCGIAINEFRVPCDFIRFDKSVSENSKTSEFRDNIKYIQTINNFNCLDSNVVNELTNNNNSLQIRNINCYDNKKIKNNYDICDNGNEYNFENLFDCENTCEVKINQLTDFQASQRDTNLSQIKIKDYFLDENYREKYLEDVDSGDKFYVQEMSIQNSFKEKLNHIASNIPNISEYEKKMFVNRMSKFERLFTQKLESAETDEYQLKIKKHTTFIRKSYPVPLAYRESVDRAIDEMLESGIIERADSPYCNPLRIVIKNDNSVRVCLDARFINEIIEDDHESPPLIHELLQKFYGVTYMSVADLATGYWQIPLHQSSRQYTAFVYNSKVYQFCRIPFGLKTAGSAFIRALSLALGDRFKETLTIYIDDFLISTSGSFLDHLNALESIFEILQLKNFTLKLEKSLFFKKILKFLGHELSTNGIRPLPDKLESILNFKKPRNKRELQQFLEICTYYRQFTIRHSDLMDPFRLLLVEKNPWRWTESYDKAFEDMKSAFVKYVELKHHIPGARYKLQTDASDIGISGVLYQCDENNELRIVSLISRCLNSAEVNYTTTEKELLAIVYSITKLRTYLLGVQFEIITDHKGLTFLLTTAYLNARLIRWSLILQQYDFLVTYCRGKDNIIADFFSRNPRSRFEDVAENNLSIDVLDLSQMNGENECYLNEMELDSELTDSLKNLSNLQRIDENSKSIIDRIEQGDKVEFYVIKESILFRRDSFLNLWQVVIPIEITDLLINCVHSKLGHPGMYKTLMYLKQYYYWKGMGKQIKNFVLTCDLCQRVKSLNIKMEGQYKLVESEKPGDLVCVDFYGPLPRSIGGLQYIFIIMDVFTKYVKLYPIKKETTAIVLKKLVELYIPELGVPNRILADHGSQFTSPKWANKLLDLNIKCIFSSIRHPQGNPVERVMRELGRLFRTLCSEKHTSWGKYVADIEYFLNITTHHSTGFSPFKLQFGLRPVNQIQMIVDFPEVEELSKDAKILLARERIQKSFEKRSRTQKASSRVELKEGDLVLLRIPKQSDAIKKVTIKFFHLFYGPYRIVKDLHNNAYELGKSDDSSKIIGTFNRSNLKKYRSIQV